MYFSDNDLKIKRHIDCDWLIEKSAGTYFCCDTRSPEKGKELCQQDVIQQACTFFHPKKKRDFSGWNQLRQLNTEP